MQVTIINHNDDNDIYTTTCFPIKADVLKLNKMYKNIIKN